MSSEALVRQSFAQQAEWCVRLGSPLTAMLVEGLGKHLNRTTGVGRQVLDWPGPPDALGDAVALRLAGALHGLVRRGRLPGLAALYPPNPLPSIEKLTTAALVAIEEAEDEISMWLAFPPQTNEVARCGVLFPGLMHIAGRTGLPLSLFEIGASAGLNLFPDKYCYRIGGEVLGDPSSPVVLAPAWSGALPEGPELKVVARRGCDRNPLSVADAGHRERLVAYIWPDQADRISRTQHAIELARQSPPQLDTADAADWVEDVIAMEPVPGVVRILFHSIAYQYFPDAAKDRISAHVESVGKMATDQTPVAWLAFEQFEQQGPRLIVRLWPGGEERVLAQADAHGWKVEWLG